MNVCFLTGSTCGPAELLSQVTLLLADIPKMCDPAASVECLPSVLYILNGIIKHHCKIGRQIEIGDKENFQRVMHSIKDILGSNFLENDEVNANWFKLIRG